MDKMKSLMNRSLSRFILFSGIILLVCTPLFYLLTKHFYAEDMIELIDSIQQGENMPSEDLETDIMAGVMIQFALIILILGVASVLTLRWVSKRLWIPFEDTLRKAEDFDVENPVIPSFMKTDIIEFDELDTALARLMSRSSDRYRRQKEFTENASHELQTPIAIMQSRLDLLIQEKLSAKQAGIVQELYDVGNRMARLNRSLLLLEKIENDQYNSRELVDIGTLVRENVSQLQELYGTGIQVDISGEGITVKANRQLSTIMVNNLLVNAFRHTPPEGSIGIAFEKGALVISNSADGAALDADKIFDRFNHTSDSGRGTGLGLSIVKAVCDYHGWTVTYSFSEGRHYFKVILSPASRILC